MFRTRLVIGVDGRPTEMMERMQGGGDGYSRGMEGHNRVLGGGGGGAKEQKA